MFWGSLLEKRAPAGTWSIPELRVCAKRQETWQAWSGHMLQKHGPRCTKSHKTVGLASSLTPDFKAAEANSLLKLLICRHYYSRVAGMQSTKVQGLMFSWWDEDLREAIIPAPGKYTCGTYGICGKQAFSHLMGLSPGTIGTVPWRNLSPCLTSFYKWWHTCTKKGSRLSQGQTPNMWKQY